MTFFSWIPEDSAPKTSAWLALYVGMTLVLTLGTIFWFRKWSKIQLEDARTSLQEDLDRNAELNLFSRLSFLHSSSSVGTKDLERGVTQR